MTNERPTNLAASIRQRLLNLSVRRNEDPNLTLTHFALGAVNRLPSITGFTRTTNTRLSARNRCCRETPGDGGFRDAEQSRKGFL